MGERFTPQLSEESVAGLKLRRGIAERLGHLTSMDLREYGIGDEDEVKVGFIGSLDDLGYKNETVTDVTLSRGAIGEGITLELTGQYHTMHTRTEDRTWAKSLDHPGSSDNSGVLYGYTVGSSTHPGRPLEKLGYSQLRLFDNVITKIEKSELLVHLP